MLDNLSNACHWGESISGRPNSAVPMRLNHGETDSHGEWLAERHAPLFSGILPGDASRICAAARIKTFARGEMLFVEGGPVDQVLLLSAGIVKITQLGLSGMEVIFRFAVRGDVLDAANVSADARRCSTAEALRTCQVLTWDASTFKAVVERFPVLSRNMVRILGRDLLELEERFREVATERVALRVARQLVRLLEKIGRPVNGAIEIALSREDLAQMTGTTLYTVSRLLSAWEARGMVRPRREAVAVCDVKSLLAISE